MLEPIDYERVFRKGERFGALKIVEVRPIGELVIVSGKLVACDPGWLHYSLNKCPPFVRRVPNGSFPATLAFAKEPKWKGAAEAAALVRFAPGKVRRWEMALRPREKLKDLGPGMFFGYGVDTGTGCFADAKTTVAYSEQLRSEREALREKQQRKGAPSRRVPTPAIEVVLLENIHDRDRKKRANVVIDTKSGANMVAFHSGFGDGAYPSFWGLDSQGRVLALVTDFLVVRPEETKAPEEAPKRKRALTWSVIDVRPLEERGQLRALAIEGTRVLDCTHPGEISFSDHATLDDARTHVWRTLEALRKRVLFAKGPSSPSRLRFASGSMSNSRG